MDRKAQSLSISTIVIIVLAVIVLVVLVLGFTVGWGSLWGRVSAFFGGSNVDSIVQACTVACTTESRYDFCEKERTVKLEVDGKLKTAVGVTCEKLAAAGIVRDKDGNDVNVPPIELECDIECPVEKVLSQVAK